MTDAPDLRPFPLSERIRRGLDRLEARLPSAFEPRRHAPRIGEALPSIHTRLVPLGRIDVDPGRMLRLKVTGEPREVGRPDATERALETCTPQFFLRDTWRVERYADPDDLEVEDRFVRDLSFHEDLARAHRCVRERPALLDRFNSDEIAVLLAEKRVVMVETAWHELYGRPDEPAAVSPDGRRRGSPSSQEA